MANHEFGIMQSDPAAKKRYDEYEPQKYNCITVNDDCFENTVIKLNCIDFYWHSLDNPAKGLAYAGITLIPPTSMPPFIDAIKEVFELSELIKLLEKAFEENKWMIHFGL